MEMVKTDCSTCNIKFEKIDDLIGHVKTDHEEQGFDLTASQRVLLLPSPRFVAAMEQHSDEETPKKKPSSGNKTKTVTIKDELPFDCDYCDRRFASRSRLKIHIKVHITEETQETDRDRSFLEENEQSREVKCVICDKKFKDQKGYKIHNGKMHAPAYSMACEICDFKCNTRSGVRKHMVEVHTYKRPITDISGFRNCDICGYESKSKHAFEVHQDEKHGEISQGSPPLKKNKKEDLDKTQVHNNEHVDTVDMESEVGDTDETQMRKKLQSLETMITEKDKQIQDLEQEAEDHRSAETMAERDHELKRIEAQQKINELENEVEYLKENADMIELNELNKDLKEKLETVKKLNTEIQNKAKEVAIKNVKLQEENETLRMTGFRIHCNVCEVDFSPTEAKNHTHIKQAPAGALTTTPMASAIPAQQTSMNHQTSPDPEVPQNLQITTPEEVMDDSPAQEIFNCVACPETRKSEATLAAHMRCHTEDGAHICNNCSYQTNDNGNMKNHTRNTHHTANLKQFECTDCGVKFNMETEMNNHRETHRGNGAPKNTCEFCELEFTSRSGIRQHMRVTHGVMREDWEQIQRENIEQVQRVIQNVEQGLRTEQATEEQSETQVEMIICNLCGVGFNNLHDMKIHKKTNHGSHKLCRNFSINDPTRCSYGQYCTFSHIPILEGKHRCFDCGEDFDSKNDMMLHRKRQHKEKVIICRKFVQGQCRLNTECWFTHPTSGTTSGHTLGQTTTSRTTSGHTSGQTNQGFQPVVEVWETPQMRQEMNQEKAKTILNNMIPQILSKIMEQLNLR